MECKANCEIDKLETSRKVYRDLFGKIVWKYVISNNPLKGTLYLRNFESCLCGCDGIVAIPSPHIRVVCTDKNNSLNSEFLFEDLKLADKAEPTSKKYIYKGDTKTLYELRAKMPPESLAKVTAQSMQMILQIHNEEINLQNEVEVIYETLD